MLLVRVFQSALVVTVLSSPSASQSVAQNTSKPLVFSSTPADMPRVQRTSNESVPYLPQMSLDVMGYPVAPPELELAQVHVYTRHGSLLQLHLTRSDS